MVFLLIKSEMLLSFPLIGYKDTFISLNVIRNVNSRELKLNSPLFSLLIALTHGFESVKTFVSHFDSWMKGEKCFKVHLMARASVS